MTWTLQTQSHTCLGLSICYQISSKHRSWTKTHRKYRVEILKLFLTPQKVLNVRKYFYYLKLQIPKELERKSSILIFRPIHLLWCTKEESQTLVLLNPKIPPLENSVDPDQMKSDQDPLFSNLFEIYMYATAMLQVKTVKNLG